MRKLTLDVDALVVESFETHRVHGAGTVLANAAGTFVPEPAEPGIRTYPNCSEIDGCPSAWGNCSQLDPSCQGTCQTCQSCVSCVSCLSNCLNTGCNGCSGPICAA